MQRPPTKFEFGVPDVEAEMGGATEGEAFWESLDAEASKIRLRLHLRKVFKSFIFQP